MEYRRVLYTRNMTEQLKSKLRILSYDKRRARKGNVYFVTFASESDMKFADRAARRLRDITLKPYQHSVSGYKSNSRITNDKKQASILPSTADSLPHIDVSRFCESDPARIALRQHSSHSLKETLEERAVRVLGLAITVSQTATSVSWPILVSG